MILNGMIVSNFLSGGDIFLNRYNLERSGMYDADEIDNIMTNRSEYEQVRGYDEEDCRFLCLRGILMRRICISCPPSQAW